MRGEADARFSSEWPHGVRCADCDVVLRPGEPDADAQPWARTIDRDEDGVTIHVVVCMDCWLKQAEDFGGAV